MPPVRSMSCLSHNPPVIIADCHAAIELIPHSGDPRHAYQDPFFQLLRTTRDILTPAAFRSGRCLVLVNEAIPLQEGWALSSPKLSTRCTPVWPTARDLAEAILQDCPMTASGHETTRLGWALTESWIDDHNHLYKVLIRGVPRGMP